MKLENFEPVTAGEESRRTGARRRGSVRSTLPSLSSGSEIHLM